MAGSSLGTSNFLTALNFNHNHPFQNYSCCLQGDISNTYLVIIPKQQVKNILVMNAYG